MADAAGIVNDRGRADDAAFNDILGASSPEIRVLAQSVRDLVYDVLPETVEVVWPRQGSVGWGTGPKKFSEQFAYLMPFKHHVTLGFYHGGELSDPGRAPASGRRTSGRRCAVDAKPQDQLVGGRPTASPANPDRGGDSSSSAAASNRLCLIRSSAPAGLISFPVPLSWRDPSPAELLSGGRGAWQLEPIESEARPGSARDIADEAPRS